MVKVLILKEKIGIDKTKLRQEKKRQRHSENNVTIKESAQVEFHA